MTGEQRAALALISVLAALLGDWVASELFPTRAPLWHVVSVLAVNGIALASVTLLIRRLAGVPRTTLLMRMAAVFGFVGLLAISLRSAGNPAMVLGFATRIAIIVGIGAAMILILRRLGDALNERLMTAITLGAVAFILVPIIARAVAPSPGDWIAAATPSTGEGERSRRATLFLLLDEFAYTAAAPLAEDLLSAGLQVQYSSLEPAGKDTQNVVPAMFSGQDFSNVRICGLSTLCSNFNVLSFAALRVQRSDVHVVGQHFPYCDIQGLASCFQVPRPFSFSSIYGSFAEYFLKRLGLHAPRFLAAPEQPIDHQRRLLDAQTHFISESDFWRNGGVLYAHLFMPHPPGLDGMTTLDADYANNIQVTRTLVASYRDRLRSGFGKNFSIVLTSDHPLRRYWCDSEWYGIDRCATRPEFQDDKVPLIIAAPESLRRSAIKNNRDVFQVLNLQVTP